MISFLVSPFLIRNMEMGNEILITKISEKFNNQFTISTSQINNIVFGRPDLNVPIICERENIKEYMFFPLPFKLFCHNYGFHFFGF
jgi:hypothetical protein